MKIALCLSGYFNSSRDLSSKGADGYNHIRKHILSKGEVDTYIHSWDLNNEQQIRELYNPKCAIFESQIDFSPISKIQPLNQGYVPQSAIFSQFYSVQKSFELLYDSKIKYDWVIKARFDLGRINRNSSGIGKPNPYPVQCINFNTTLNPKKFYTANWQYIDSEGPADMWFYSNYNNMKHFTNTFDIIKRDMVIGGEMEEWAGKENNGLLNAIKCWKWFLIKSQLWNNKILLDTTWE